MTIYILTGNGLAALEGALSSQVAAQVPTSGSAPSNTAAIPVTALGQPSGPAELGPDGKVVGSELVNRAAIPPNATSVGTAPVTLWTASALKNAMSVRVKLLTPGVQLAVTGDGSTPVIGTSPTINAVGAEFSWPDDSDAMPTGPVQAIASGPCTIRPVAN